MSNTPNVWSSSTATPGSRAASAKSGASPTAETTPLLNRSNSHDSERAQLSQRSHTLSSNHDADPRDYDDEEQTKKRKGRERRPSTLALLLLCITAVLIIIMCFALPATVEEYAKDAIQFTPEQLVVDGFTTDGVRIDLRGDVSVDANRVRKGSARTVGRIATWIVGKVKSGPGKVEVLVPEYGNMVLGTAKTPPLTISVRNGHTTALAFQSEVQPGSIGGLKKLVGEWIDGKLGSVEVKGNIIVPLTAGSIPIGEKRISKLIEFQEDKIPTLPSYSIIRLYVYEMDLPNSHKAMAIDVTLDVDNPYPVGLTVPPLGFKILVDNCSRDEPFIRVANAVTQAVPVQPGHAANVSVNGLIEKLPNALTEACPNSRDSPLDSFLGDYLHGQDATIYVQSSRLPKEVTPEWISDILSGMTIPIPFPGHSYDHLIRQFTLSDVQFELPDQTAPPDAPAAKPRVSGNVEALVSLPEEMNLNLDVESIRAKADIYHKGKKMGILDISKWQDAKSSAAGENDEGKTLLIKSHIDDAPVDITDEDVFADVLQSLIFGDEDVLLKIKADVDVQLQTALGQFAVKKIPAEGVIPVKPISGGGGRRDGFPSIAPSLKNFRIRGTSRHILEIEALISFTNPTNYSASVPFFDINILSNGTLLGNATAENISVIPGRNENLLVSAKWDPEKLSGSAGLEVGIELLSQYVSGFNTSITIRAHEGSVPAMPKLGEVLKRFEWNMTTPRLKIPGEPEDGDGDGDGDGSGNDDDARKSHFIKGAIMHLLSSTATFTLASPLPKTTLFITELHATAYYHQPDGLIHSDVNDDKNLDNKNYQGYLKDDGEATHLSKPSSFSSVSFSSSSSSSSSASSFSIASQPPSTSSKGPSSIRPNNDNDNDNDPSLGDPVGTIDHSLPFAVPPGISTTPRLPVVWNAGSVGYAAVRQALGGSLRLGARARVRVRVGAWEEELWFMGTGIGAGVRL